MEVRIQKLYGCCWSKASSSYPKYPNHVIVSCLNQNPLPVSPLQSFSLNKTLHQIQSSGVIACLRAPSAELALGAAHAALEGGISVLGLLYGPSFSILEVVVSCPGVFQVIEELIREHPTMTIGVGTILHAEDAKCAVQSGAHFLLSPAMVKDVLYNVQDTEVLYIPGAMTPTEILCAHKAGAKMVKVYPVAALGGAQYICALRKPFANIPMIASQGITIDAITEYIAGGASAVVLSDAIFDKKAMFRGDLKTISKLAKHAALLGSEAVEQFRLAQDSVH